uniref:Uncharacterized protein n=1 Tax=viral metagenome TaxID=1070528 RepID=A0A6C0EHH1_9ZZZZ
MTHAVAEHFAYTCIYFVFVLSKPKFVSTLCIAGNILSSYLLAVFTSEILYHVFY